jgi:hypothetical protein
MNIKRRAVIVLVCFFAGRAFGADFGLTWSVEPEYRSGYAPEDFSVTGKASPWISGILGDGLFYHISLSVTADYEEQELLSPLLFELDRTELSFKPSPSVLINAGRQRFRDATAFAASGLFDGLSAGAGFSWGRLSAGAFYTGFLYKKTAEILMTFDDLQNYGKDLDYGDLKSYFASRRVLAYVSGDFPDLGSRSTLRLDLLTQFDVNDADNRLHSQYLLGLYSFRPVEALALNLGGGLELLQAAVRDDMQIAFAASAGADWELPTTVTDMLSLEFRWASGAENDTVTAFMPINGITQGVVLSPKISGLARAKAAYTARLHKSLSAGAGFNYFLRTDTVSFADSDLDPASTSRLLGGEAYGSAVWAPGQEIRVTLEGGVFFPRLGKAFNPDTPVRWKISGGLIMSF